jgi:hypothetical protein
MYASMCVCTYICFHVCMYVYTCMHGRIITVNYSTYDINPQSVTSLSKTFRHCSEVSHVSFWLTAFMICGGGPGPLLSYTLAFAFESETTRRYFDYVFRVFPSGSKLMQGQYFLLQILS